MEENKKKEQEILRVYEIKPLSEKEFEEALRELMSRDLKEFSDVISSLDDGSKLTPSSYEFIQPHPLYFNPKISFLKILIGIINELDKKDNSVVLESGCATGIDISAIAKIFPHITFRGFDISKDMVEIGKKRIEENKLSNAEIYLSDNLNPGKEEISSCDLLFNHASLFPYKKTPKSLAKEISLLSQRIKNGGRLVIGGIDSKYLYEELNEELEIMGIKQDKVYNCEHDSSILVLCYTKKF